MKAGQTLSLRDFRRIEQGRQRRDSRLYDTYEVTVGMPCSSHRDRVLRLAAADVEAAKAQAVHRLRRGEVVISARAVPAHDPVALQIHRDFECNCSGCNPRNR